MRYSRSQENRPRQGSGPGRGIALILVIVIGGVLIYLAGAGILGSFVSEKIVSPVMAWITGEPQDTEEPSDITTEEAEPSNSEEPSESNDTEETGEQTTQKVGLEAKTVYLLQVGAYADETNANQSAQEQQARGAAGYVLKDGDTYRVFLSAYPTEEEAESVKERLKSEQNMDTKVYPLGYEELNFNVTADKNTAEILDNAFLQAPALTQTLYTETLSYDKKEIDDTGIKEKISALQGEVDQVKADLDGVLQAESNDIVEQMSGFYGAFSEGLEKISKESQTGVEISANLKYTYIDLINRQIQILNAING